MEKLVELAQLVTGFITPGNARSLFGESNTDPKAYLLFDGILSGRFKTDELAARELYRCKPSDKKYLMLKSRVKNRLFQLVFSMDLSKRIKSEYIKALHACNKNLFAAQELISLGYRNLVSENLKKTYHKSIKFHFTDIQLAIARLLRDHEVFTGNVGKIKEYNNQIDEILAMLLKELESERYFQVIRSFFRYSVNQKENVLLEAEECFRKSKALMQSLKKPNNLIISNALRVSIYYYHLKKDHLKSLEACNAFEKYLNSNPIFENLGVVAEINMQKLDTALYLRDYEIGKKSAESCLKTFHKSVTNWTVVQELYFLLCVHTTNYAEASKVIREVRSIKQFSNFSKERIERWKIFEAFLSYILPSRRGRKQFNVHRFVNEVPVFSRDKIGYNLSIIVAQVILLVKEGDFDRVMDKYDSLKSYARRHIHQERSPRSFYFVKMMLAMIKHDFDPEKTESAAARYFEKLCAARIGDQGVLETLEVIPYDVLWPDLLRKLKKHKQNPVPA